MRPVAAGEGILDLQVVGLARPQMERRRLPGIRGRRGLPLVEDELAVEPDAGKTFALRPCLLNRRVAGAGPRVVDAQPERLGERRRQRARPADAERFACRDLLAGAVFGPGRHDLAAHRAVGEPEPRIDAGDDRLAREIGGGEILCFESVTVEAGRLGRRL